MNAHYLLCFDHVTHSLRSFFAHESYSTCALSISYTHSLAKHRVWGCTGSQIFAPARGRMAVDARDSLAYVLPGRHGLTVRRLFVGVPPGRFECVSFCCWAWRFLLEPRATCYRVFYVNLGELPSVSVDQEDNFYVAEVDSGRIQKFRPRQGVNPAFLVSKPVYSAWN